VLTDRYNTQLGGKWNRMMTIPQGICALYQNTPSLTTYDDVADRPVNLAPVGEKSKLERCGYVDVTSFSKIIADPSHDIRILNGIGYDWRSLQLGEALQPTVDASDPDCPLRVEYTLPPVDSDSLTVILYTVPRFPLYKGANARFAIAVDDAAPVVTNLIPKEQSKPWKDDVIRNATVTRATFPISRSATSHRLAINCGDPGLIVERILLDWGGLKPTYVGPSNPQQFQ
jgi:hypothetical protein